jgi:hypothetical protein
VKYLAWTIVVVGIFLICVSSVAVVRVDDPETAYDESETPFNIVASLSTNTVLRPPTVRVDRAIKMFRLQRVGLNDSAMTYATTTMLAAYPSRFRLNLLNETLLC